LRPAETVILNGERRQFFVQNDDGERPGNARLFSARKFHERIAEESMTRISPVSGPGSYAAFGVGLAHGSSPSLSSCALAASEEPPGDTRSDRSEVGLMNGESNDTEAPPISGERGEAPDVLLLPAELSVIVDGVRVALTRTQFSIFCYFHENSGRWVTPNELIRHVLGTHHQPDTSLVRVHVHAIRRRLGQGAVWLESDPRRVRGYRWCGQALARREVS
jgi:hypothetical protein